jgi:predicted ATPase
VAETSFTLGISHLIDLRGETGVGKTRIVHELYRRLVVDDPYWPSAITGKNQRKAIYPHAAPLGEMPMLMWLGVPCGRESNGAPLALLEAHLSRQLEAHARGFLLRSARSEGRKAALATAAKAIVGLLGVDAINNILDLCGHYEELREVSNDLRRGRETSERKELFEVSSWVDENTVSACIDIARLLAENEIPLIVAIEDAHDADPTLLAFVRRLLVESLGTLVITTSWPTAVNAQCDNQTGFGQMLQEIHASVPALRLDISSMQTGDLQALVINRLGASGNDDVLEDSRHLAERAAGNPLHLMLLADVAEANGISLGEGRTQDNFRRP